MFNPNKSTALGFGINFLAIESFRLLSLVAVISMMTIGGKVSAQSATDSLTWQQFQEDASSINRNFSARKFDKIVAEVTTLRSSYSNYYSAQLPAFKANMAYMRGVSLAETGFQKGAVSELTDSIRWRPSMQAYYRRGLAHAATDKPSDAINDFTHALFMAPDDDEAAKAEFLLQRANQHYAMRAADKALSDLNDAISMKQDGLLFTARGEVYLAQQEYTKARADLDRALSLDTGKDIVRSVRILSNRAAAAAYLGDTDAAIFDYTRIVAKNAPETSRLDAHMSRAILYHMRRDPLAAMYDYDEVFPKLENASEQTRQKAATIIDGLKRGGLYSGKGDVYDEALRAALEKCVSMPSCGF